MQAHPYGHTRVMSSFAFEDPSQGPPADANGNIISPEIVDGQCVNGWVCEHRWPAIYRMVQFRNIVKDEGLANWWTNGDNQIAFSRGAKGFVAFNLNGDLKESLQTGLPAGTYCDIITKQADGQCKKSVTVKDDGTADIEILADEAEGVLALHIQVSRNKNREENQSNKRMTILFKLLYHYRRNCKTALLDARCSPNPDAANAESRVTLSAIIV